MLTPTSWILPKFVGYACRSEPFTNDVTAESVGVVYPAIAEARLASVLRLCIPTLPEQHAIVRFLDHADRRIQRYVRAQERLIELLKEQKQGIIRQAVTGQIDVRTGQPYPAYKDSGVEWLGKVPEHWEVRRVANIADMRVSNVDKHFKEEEEPIRLCNYIDVYHNDRIRRTVAFMSATATKAEIQRFRLAIGDVLLTKDSEDWTDIGVPALVEYASADLVCGYHLAMLRPNCACMDAGYLFHSLGDSGVARQLRVAANGVTRYGLSRHAIKGVCIPLPPVVEQRSIVRFLDRADRRTRHRVSATKRQITLLREYQTRLIADVVTGKLDVREAAARLPVRPDLLPESSEDPACDSLECQADAAPGSPGRRGLASAGFSATGHADRPNSLLATDREPT